MLNKIGVMVVVYHLFYKSQHKQKKNFLYLKFNLFISFFGVKDKYSLMSFSFIY